MECSRDVGGRVTVAILYTRMVLLADAALDSAERNIIATALNGDYSPARAAQELRNQFPETELRRKDQGRRSHAFVSMDDIYETENYDEHADYGEDNVEEEDQVMLAAAEEEAQQAMATMERARRTLKDARMRQHSVKMNRQYYRGNYQNRASGAGGSGRPSSSTGGQWQLRTEQRREHDLFGLRGERPQGEAKHGNARLSEVDQDNQPLFGFGNSTEGRCLSTCQVGVTAGGHNGQVQIHTLNQGVGPILFSIDALRTLGAIVDFRSDLLVLTAINDKKIIPASPLLYRPSADFAGTRPFS